MQHFVNFGAVRVVNKKLKQLYESKPLVPTGESLGEMAQKVSGSENKGFSGLTAKRTIDTRKRGVRYNRTSLVNIDPLSRPYKKETAVDYDKLPDWSDVRRTTDTAASPTGYLGFRKDPYKGFGGMMEESIPANELALAPSRKNVLVAEEGLKGRRIARDYDDLTR